MNSYLGESKIRRIYTSENWRGGGRLIFGLGAFSAGILFGSLRYPSLDEALRHSITLIVQRRVSTFSICRCWSTRPVSLKMAPRALEGLVLQILPSGTYGNACYLPFWRNSSDIRPAVQTGHSVYELTCLLAASPDWMEIVLEGCFFLLHKTQPISFLFPIKMQIRSPHIRNIH